MTNTNNLNIKLTILKQFIFATSPLAVAFSGGVDSTFLLAVAKEVLGDNVIALTAYNAAIPKRELKEAEDFCAERGIRHIICRIDPFKDENIRSNPRDRCYHCKYRLFSEFKRIASENGFENLADGTNIDDNGDYRPGLRATAELQIISPLKEAGLRKSDIRELSKAMNLSTWDKPAYACLATRIACGEEITEGKLDMIERAEQILVDNGFAEERVRVHGSIARIEVAPEDIARLASDGIRETIYEEFKKIGFVFVTLDMRGYTMGSMNGIYE